MPFPAGQSESNKEPEFGCSLTPKWSQKYDLNNVGLKDTWFVNESWGTLVNEAWGTLVNLNEAWGTLVNLIETWGTLVSYSAVNTRETTWQRHQLTNLQPNCLLPCPQITGSTGILAYFYKKVCAQKFTQGTQRDSAQAPPQLLNSFELRICPDQFGSCNARLLRWHRPKEWVTKWWTIEIE